MKKTVLAAVIAAVLSAGLATVIAWWFTRSSLEAEIAALKGQVSLIFRGIYSSGGGVNLKMMPDPKTGEPKVPLQEVFSFDRNHAFCRVDTNPQAFKMQTYQMGEMVIEAGRFFMSMAATSIEEYRVSTGADGKSRVVMEGGLLCSTEVGQASITIGSRRAAEHATYRIEATDGGIGGGKAGDAFAFTVFFDPQKAPLNHRIFGPEFTFTGSMVEGEITIIDPSIALNK